MKQLYVSRVRDAVVAIVAAFTLAQKDAHASVSGNDKLTLLPVQVAWGQQAKIRQGASNA